MELQIDPSDDLPSVSEPSPELDQSIESLAPLRKRQRQNLQDLSNTKPLAPLRASGRIRIKMTAAAELKPPEPALKPVKVFNNNCTNIKQRRRPKKLKTDLVSDLAIDVKRPSSVLVDTSIRALLSTSAFSQLSPENQKILIEGLPLVDRPVAPSKEYHGIELNPSSINNEFFNRACIEWRDRLSNGEFTNEHQTKLRAEQEREKSKIDPWKARNFEGIWGIKSNGHGNAGGAINVGAMMEKSALEMKDRVKQGDFEIPERFISEVWNRDGSENIETTAEMDDTNWQAQSSPFHSSSQNSTNSNSAPTPPETVTSTQLESSEEHSNVSLNPEPDLDKCQNHTPDLPIIAEATSSADDSPFEQKDYEKPSTSNYIGDDDYAGEIASKVELSSEGLHTKWFHQQEHDYLKNVQEPEPSGMDEMNAQYENNIIEEDVEEYVSENNDEVVETAEVADDMSTEKSISRLMENVSSMAHGNSRINSYDSELPQEIFHESGDVSTSFHRSSPSVVVNNYIHHHQESNPIVVRQIIESTAARFNSTIIVPEKQQNYSKPFQHHDTFMMEESEVVDPITYRDEIHMNVQKNVKLLAFPSRGVKYSDKIIIDETPQHIHHQQQQQQQQHIHQPTSSFRTNGATSMPPSYFVGGTNFAYISKMGSKIESVDSPRIIKQEANNNQGQLKQRIIYEIASEPKVSYEQPSTHHLTYATQPHQEVFHQMVKHPNGTTTIYETTAPSTKKTIIQRKKNVDPYTVQVVANNNTIILTPIGNTSQHSVQQQPQKSILHIHRSTPLLQSNAQPVQFLTAPQTLLKKQTIIHPNQMTQNPQANYTTVIRTPSTPVQQQIITTVSSKIQQRPIQKQKVIMSTSSLQQYRSYNQKPSSHGSRKQLHPQHIIRPAPSSTATTTVIQQMTQEPQPNQNQIPVLLPTSNNEHVIISTPISINANQVQNAVLGPPPGVNNIYVRPKRPQQIFHPSHTHISNVNTLMTTLNDVNSLNTQQILTTAQPRMRHQPNNQRPPPGTVNLERSYQICQAVIQNSANPNRLQLNNQLKPPPSNMGPKKFS